MTQQERRERRRHLRFRFDRYLEVRGPAIGMQLVMAHDISESGFSFTIDTPLAVGTNVQLALRGEGEFLVGARVCYIRPAGDRLIVGAGRLPP